MTWERPDWGSIGRRRYLQATGGGVLGTVGLAGCVGQATGTLATHVTDQPADIGDFESLVVTIDGIWLGPEGAESGADDVDADDADSDDADSDDVDADDVDADEADSDDVDADEADSDDADSDDMDDTDDASTDDTEEGSTDDTEGESDDIAPEPSGREYHAFDAPQEADLVQLQGSETQLIDERDLDVSSYQFLQLDVTETDAVLTDGSAATVDLPGNAPLTFNAPFEIREDTRTSFTADFAPIRRGRTETYVLRPVPDGIEVTYEEGSS